MSNRIAHKQHQKVDRNIADYRFEGVAEKSFFVQRHNPADSEDRESRELFEESASDESLSGALQEVVDGWNGGNHSGYPLEVHVAKFRDGKAVSSWHKLSPRAIEIALAQLHPAIVKLSESAGVKVRREGCIVIVEAPGAHRRLDNNLEALRVLADLQPIAA